MSKPNWDASDFWKYYTSPARPDVSEIEVIRPYVESGQRVLILGSTPELRDLCIECSAVVDVIDYSAKTYKALTALMHHARQSVNEHFIEAHWQELKVVEQYDVILGDHVLNVTPPDQWPTLLQNFSNALKITGLFITRTIVQSSASAFPISDIFARARECGALDRYLSVTLHDLFDHGLTDHGPKCASINLKAVFQRLQQAYAHGIVTETELAYYQTLGYDKMAVIGYMPKQNYLEGVLGKHFVPKGKLSGDIFYKARNPIFVLGKKVQNSD